MKCWSRAARAAPRTSPTPGSRLWRRSQTTLSSDRACIIQRSPAMLQQQGITTACYTLTEEDHCPLHESALNAKMWRQVSKKWQTIFWRVAAATEPTPTLSARASFEERVFEATRRVCEEFRIDPSVREFAPPQNEENGSLVLQAPNSYFFPPGSDLSDVLYNSFKYAEFAIAHSEFRKAWGWALINEPLVRLLLRELSFQGPRDRGKRLISVGSGKGVIERVLADRGARVDTIDRPHSEEFRDELESVGGQPYYPVTMPMLPRNPPPAADANDGVLFASWTKRDAAQKFLDDFEREGGKIVIIGEGERAATHSDLVPCDLFAKRPDWITKFYTVPNFPGRHTFLSVNTPRII